MAKSAAKLFTCDNRYAAQFTPELSPKNKGLHKLKANGVDHDSVHLCGTAGNSSLSGVYYR